MTAKRKRKCRCRGGKGRYTMEKSNREKHYIRIDAHHNLFDLKLKEVWRYRDLIWLFTKRSFQVSYKQTILGPAWMFISPIFSSVVYTIVFGDIAGIQTDGIPHILFYMVSNAVWSFFASSLTGNASTFTANAGIFGKVYFPRLAVPVSNVLSGVIRMGIHFIVTTVLLVYYAIQGEVSPHLWALLLIPLVLIHIGIMGMSCGIIISSLTTKYRDLSVFVGFGMSLWMYATPIVYPISQVTIPWLNTVLLCNPATMPVEIFRYALLGKGYFNPISMLISIAFTLVVAFFGIMLFNKVERNFMDTV